MKTPALALVLASLLASAAFAEPPAAAPKIKTVTPDEAEKLIKERKDIVVLDVRTPEEFVDGHIAGAKNLSILDLDFKDRLKEFEGKPVVLHCTAGSRSARALVAMDGRNFPEIFHMSAGIKGWQEAGKSLVKSPAELK